LHRDEAITPHLFKDQKFKKDVYKTSWKKYMFKKKKSLIVIVPIGIPGMGKTCFLKIISKLLLNIS
jgi:hypothetical protein